ncbi:MAG: hypothetical protein QXN25_05295 [Desulfurococcaceae archaeon]
MSSPKRVGLPPAAFIDEVISIVNRARDKGVVLRVLGATAVYIHTMDRPGSIKIYQYLKRFKDGEILFTDLDLIGYSKQRSSIISFFEKELGFKVDPYIKALFGARRLVYYHPQNLYSVDVFFDKLEFSHDIVFGNKPGKGRLELDYPTISLADLLLEKLQIHKINRKDLVDLAVLLHGHWLCKERGERDRDCIDDDYVASVLASDWGFWYDAVLNLNKLASFVSAELSIVDANASKTVQDRIRALMDSIEKKPKSKEWIKRSKIGTSKPWYREVEEIER